MRLGLLGVPVGPSHLVEERSERRRERLTVRDAGARPVAVPAFVHRVRGNPRSTVLFAGSGQRCVTTLPRV